MIVDRRGQHSVSARAVFGLALLLALAFAVVVAGCGEDENAGAESLGASSLSKAQYVEQADEGCAEERRKALVQFVRYSRKVEDESEPAQTYEVGSRRFFAPSLERQAKAIRDLGAPEGDEEEIEALLAEMERSSASLRERPASDLGGYTARLRRMANLARDYGFAQCGSASLL